MEILYTFQGQKSSVYEKIYKMFRFFSTRKNPKNPFFEQIDKNMKRKAKKKAKSIAFSVGL